MTTRVLGDWGGTRLRLYRMEDGVVTARLNGPGTTALEAPARDVLAQRLAVWQAEGALDSVTLCGMAGSPAGPIAAPYVACPADFADWHESRARGEVAGVPVEVLGGMSCREGGVPEVMRGEETQIFGAIVLDADLGRGQWRLVLPGTHSKWVDLDGGEIRSFRTAPTGEVFALLSQQSSLTGQDTPGEGTFDDGFERGLARSAEPTLGALFEARAARMLDGRSRDWSRGYLSGLLIGGEVAQFARPDEAVVIIGDPTLAGLYSRAVEAVGAQSRCVDGDAAVLSGLQRASAIHEGTSA